MKEIFTNVIKLFEKPTLTNLGTVSPDNKPWVRAMMASADDSGNVVMATFKSSRKVSHLKHNDEVHIAYGGNKETPKYYQIQGKAVIEEAPELKQKFWSPALAHYFKDVNDPEYVLLVVKPYKMIVSSMGQDKPEIFE